MSLQTPINGRKSMGFPVVSFTWSPYRGYSSYLARNLMANQFFLWLAINWMMNCSQIFRWKIWMEITKHPSIHKKKLVVLEFQAFYIWLVFFLMFYVHPENWGRFSPNLTSIFCQDGLVQPPTINHNQPTNQPTRPRDKGSIRPF